MLNWPSQQPANNPNVYQSPSRPIDANNKLNSLNDTQFDIWNFIIILSFLACFIYCGYRYCRSSTVKGEENAGTKKLVAMKNMRSKYKEVEPPTLPGIPEKKRVIGCRNHTKRVTMKWAQGNPYEDDEFLKMSPSCRECLQQIDITKTFAHCHKCKQDICHICSIFMVKITYNAASKKLQA